ncbi:MAG: monomethylamine:corrinoid methyltransferase [Acidimicrobiia bacterium]|nr:monomethylamine:corrinoid methyltransferase [Acidimicrobiia bacterium]
MQKKPDILEVLSRAQTGEYCTQKEWDTKKIPLTIRNILKEHGLQKTCDMDNPVNTDMELADKFYAAGYQAALELGYLCTDTDRIISVTQEELDDALRHAPAEVTVGEGKDATVIKARTPSDPYPMKAATSLGITVSEDLFPTMAYLIANEREVDILEAGSLITVRGHEVLSGTPIETVMGYEHGVMHREARRKAGRPGMGAIGSISAVTEFGQFGAYGTPGGFRNTDLALILFPSEMKIDYRTLHKVVHTLNMGGIMKCDSPGMIGGMPGPAEGAAVSSIACALLSYAILQNHVGGGEIYDVRYLSNVNREGLWALSVVFQALSRNTHTLCHGIANQVSGPGTENLLREIAAGVSVLAASGSSLTTGPRSAGGKLHDFVTPLECRFVAEVSHAASGMELSKVNEVVKALLPKYEDSIKEPDLGVPFQKAYNMDTLEPTPEWEAAYRKVKAECIELGIPLDAS